MCYQCTSPLTLWVRIPVRRGLLNTTLCDRVCQWLATDRWFSQGPPVSITNKTDRHDIAEILLKVALNTITLILYLWIRYVKWQWIFYFLCILFLSSIIAKTFTGLSRLYIWVILWVFYKKQEFLTACEDPSSPPVVCCSSS